MVNCDDFVHIFHRNWFAKRGAHVGVLPAAHRRVYLKW
jgi:hypothetical protein